MCLSESLAREKVTVCRLRGERGWQPFGLCGQLALATICMDIYQINENAFRENKLFAR